MIRKTIINADDFGLNSTVNKAIVECFNKGLINSSTIMANMPGSEDAIEFIHARKLYTQIGVHLTLTEGKPLTQEIKSLNLFFNREVIPFPLRIKKLLFLTRKQKCLIFNEYSAQVQKVLRSGISITHIDTHHQLHDMYSIMQIIIELLRIYKIPSMRILNNLRKSDFFYKNAYRNLVNRYLKVRNVNFTDFFGNQIDFISFLKKNPDFLNKENKSIEIMVHPDLSKDGIIFDKINGLEYSFSFQRLFKEFQN